MHRIYSHSNLDIWCLFFWFWLKKKSNNINFHWVVISCSFSWHRFTESPSFSTFTSVCVCVCVSTARASEWRCVCVCGELLGWVRVGYFGLPAVKGGVEPVAAGYSHLQHGGVHLYGGLSWADTFSRKVKAEIASTESGGFLICICLRTKNSVLHSGLFLLLTAVNHVHVSRSRLNECLGVVGWFVDYTVVFITHLGSSFSPLLLSSLAFSPFTAVCIELTFLPSLV